MKKVLLGTTALLGAGLVASPAFAADGIKLGVGGFFKTAYMVNFDDDGEGERGNERNTDGVFSDAEIHFTGETTLDNGLTVGARVELEGEDNSGDGNDQIDEAWIYFAGGFGELRMGSDDDALANACIVPPGGTGNFSAPQITALGLLPGSIADGDFNLDGHLDLLVAFDADPDVVAMLLGDGAGGFTSNGVVAATSPINGILTSDFNEDGLADLAIATARDEMFPAGHTSPVGMVDMLFGNGAGGFVNPTSFVAGELARDARPLNARQCSVP